VFLHTLVTWVDHDNSEKIQTERGVQKHFWHGIGCDPVWLVVVAKDAPCPRTELPGYPPFMEKTITGKMSA